MKRPAIGQKNMTLCELWGPSVQNLLHMYKVIIYKLHGEPLLWNRIWYLGWLAVLKTAQPITSPGAATTGLWPVVAPVSVAHLSTAVAWREKKFKRFVFNKYFCLVLGVFKSKISKKSNEGLGRKLDFKLFHYKARVQPVGKITTIATRNRC